MIGPNQFIIGQVVKHKLNEDRRFIVLKFMPIGEAFRYQLRTEEFYDVEFYEFELEAVED